MTPRHGVWGACVLTSVHVRLHPTCYLYYRLHCTTDHQPHTSPITPKTGGIGLSPSMRSQVYPGLVNRFGKQGFGKKRTNSCGKEDNVRAVDASIIPRTRQVFQDNRNATIVSPRGQHTVGRKHDWRNCKVCTEWLFWRLSIGVG